MLKLRTLRFALLIATLAMIVNLALSDAAFAKQKRGRFNDKKAGKFINGHDARDGGWMEQKPNEPTTPQTPAASQPKFDYKPSPEESELIRLSQEWMDVALIRKDEKRLREIMSPDFTLQIWDASRAPQPLEAWLDTLRRRLDRIQFEYSGLNARVFGDVAVVYSRFWWKGTMNGQPFTDSGFLADVWVRKQGRWQVIARRSAPQQQIQEILAVGKKQ